jgi:hypothetical protein
MASKLEKRLLEKRLKSIEDINGKTVAKVLSSGSSFLLAFTDGTWLGMESYEIYGCIETGVMENVGNIYDFETLGFVTREEIDASREASNRAWKLARDREERKLYNNLRKKFEK